MRTLFFLLIIVNLCVFLWFHYEAEARAGTDIEPIPEGSPTVILVGEFNQDKPLGSSAAESGRLAGGSGDASAPAASGRVEVRSDANGGSSTAAAVATAPRQRCLLLGPFGDVQTARDLRRSLERLGFDVRSKKEATQAPPDGYSILIPDLPSVAAAENMMLRLRENGIRDIRQGESGGKVAVLLGYYKSAVLAEQRRKRIARYGFAPVVRPVAKTAESYSLYYELLQDEPSLLPESLAEYRSKSSVVDCKLVVE